MQVGFARREEMIMSVLSESIKEKNLKYNLFTWTAQGGLDPMVIDRGEGLYMYDVDGNKYLEFASDQVCCNIGKSHPKVVQAIKDQAEKIAYAGSAHATQQKGDLAEKIIKKLPEGFGKVLFTNAGADANESAVKIARMYTGREKTISRYRSYHGCTAGAASLTGDNRRWVAEPGIPGAIRVFDHQCYHCPYHKDPETCGVECATQIEEIIKWEDPDNIACIVIESVVGANGMYPPPNNYMKIVREICDKYGILMICDEVMAGFGRTGEWFAFQNYDVVPDIVTMAKGLTSGYIPLGAVAVKQEIADFFDEHVLKTGLTYSGHVLCCAVGNAVMDVMEEEHLVEHSKEMGKYLLEQEKELQKKHPCIGDVRGIGLMTGMELVFNRETHAPIGPLPDGTDPIGELEKFCFSKGLMPGIKHPALLTLCPSLPVTKEQIDQAISIVDEGLKIVDSYYKR